jgi:hypothetical protein
MRDWALDPTLITFIGRIPGMVPVCVGGEVVVPVWCKSWLNDGWGGRV